MDPITTVLVAAVSAGVTQGVTAAGKKAVVDAYNGLKKIISSKFGKESQVSKAIAELEKEPDSKGRQTILLEQVTATKVDQDPEILEIAHELNEALMSTEAGRTAIAKYQVDAKGARIGVLGDGAHIEGDIRFGESKE